MQLGVGVPKNFSVPRCEARIPMEIGVELSGHRDLPGSEPTFTQNVSSRGARVRSTRRWKRNERLKIATPNGSFQSVARVAYCKSGHESGFVVGLEFLASTGSWIIPDPKDGN